MPSPLIPRLVIEKDSQWSFGFNENDLHPITWRDEHQRSYAFVQIVDNCFWIHWIKYASFCIEPGKDVVIAHTYPEVDEVILQDIYRQSILPYVVQLSGVEVLHASAVQTANGVVGFCAVSGSGKSTIAYGLYKLGHPFWTDDSLVFEIDQSVVRCYKIPYEVRLLPDSYEYLLEQDFAQLHRESEYHSRIVKLGVRQLTSLGMLFILERATTKEGASLIEFTQLSGGAAFSKLLSHAYILELEDEARKRQMLDTYMDLITKIPIYELRYATDLNHFPTLLAEIQNKIDQEFR